ncbi:hypothetical protein CXIVA_01940 [Clostridium sp. SY8519]|uniref:hypothetical protein n=1 Tax=Clostridium sp. (strain SY8519) TaxID=1042156 RepID=UPI0002171F88|nr:hypothetical protein [Clostridium sp. SY8519]BAK46161.1 hypothetical protein CXIVA_01940 [Clostridium sp. SY8519]
MNERNIEMILNEKINYLDTHVDSQLIKSAVEKIGCTVEGVPPGVPSKCGNP